MRLASAGIAAIVVGSAASLALGQLRASQEKQPDFQGAEPAAIPGALALAGGSPSASFGFVSTQANELLVRSETSESALFKLINALPNVAVAPNGRSVAVWTRGDPVDNRFTWSLRVLDAIDRTLGPVLLTATDEFPYGAMRWSTDGTGLIVGTQTPVPRSPQRPGPGSHNSWFAIDVPSGTASRLAALESSLATAVYSWDRQRNLITGAGVVADADRTTYLVLRSGILTTFSIPPRRAVIAADAYAGALVVAGLGSCTDARVPGTGCLYAEIRDQATFSTIATLPSVPTTMASVPRMLFRPRSQDLIVSFIEPNGDVRDELWSDLGRGNHRTLSMSVAAADRQAVDGVIPRADGSAVFIFRFDSSGSGRWYGVLIDLANAAQTPFEIRTGGNPLASVVLDRTYASMMARQGGSTATSAAPLPTSSVPLGYVASTACTQTSFAKATDGTSARWTFACKGLMTREAWREGLRRSAIEQGWREVEGQSDLLQFVKDDLQIAMAIDPFPQADAAFVLTQTAGVGRPP